MCLATARTISGLWKRGKMTQPWLRCSSFHEHCSSSGALGFQVWLRLRGSRSNSGFWSFSDINILIDLVCLNLNGKLIKSSTQNEEHIINF